MDVWIGRKLRASNCSYCGEVIESGSACVFGKLWTKPPDGDGGLKVRRWTVMFHWHVYNKDGNSCWIEQAMKNLELRDLQRVERRGRKSMGLDGEAKEQRLSVLRRRARVLQRLKEVLTQRPESLEEIIHLGQQLEDLKVEISTVGGIPRSWLMEEELSPLLNSSGQLTDVMQEQMEAGTS